VPKLEQSFDVDAPRETVWSALVDVQRVAPCLPGAEITERREDGSYAGTFSAKIGPASASYRGTITIEEADEATHTARMLANGSDKRGQGGAKATIVSTLSDAPGGGTRVEVVTEYSITGRLAAFGRGGMIQDVSNRLLREFASCLQTRLAEEAGTPWAIGGDAPASSVDVHPAAALAETEALQQDREADRASAPATAPPSSPPTSPGPSPAPAPGAPRSPAGTGQATQAAKAQPVQGVRLLLQVLWDRVDRWVRRRLDRR
jgi:carbon monoxide dehydrogenase subunit G